jgi:uncharacterized membrane protein (UPF0127 family)
LKAINLRNREILSDNVQLADTPLKRMKGLLGRKEFYRGESLWIKPCNSIHTIGMKFPIDLLFLNRKNKVISLKKDFQPNRITGFSRRAVSVLELPSGTLTATDTRVGDMIEIA